MDKTAASNKLKINDIAGICIFDVESKSLNCCKFSILFNFDLSFYYKVSAINIYFLLKVIVDSALKLMGLNLSLFANIDRLKQSLSTNSNIACKG